MLLDKPVTEPVIASVPVTVTLPAFTFAMLELGKVFAAVKMFVLARYAMVEVPAN